MDKIQKQFGITEQQDFSDIDWIEIDKHIEAINRYENVAEKINKLRDYYQQKKKKRNYERR